MKPIWLIFVGMALLAGCAGDDHSDLLNWMDNEAKHMQPNVPQLPKLVQFPVVEYEVASMVDPFQASRLSIGRPMSGPQPTPHTPEPLEAFPLESLRMVGMMMMNGKPVALIQADRTIYQAKAGNYLGQNYGVITKITENDLTLKELVEDPNENGAFVERFSTIQLQEQETKK